jgi:hypothetical protein
MRIWESSKLTSHPGAAWCFVGLAEVHSGLGRYGEAERFYKRALEVREATLPPDHPVLAETRLDYAGLLRKLQRDEEAAVLEDRARAASARTPSDVER